MKISTFHDPRSSENEGFYMAPHAEVLNHHYIPADDIFEVATARQEIRDDAWATVRLREQQLAAGQEVIVPMAVDALSTAETVLEAARLHGQSSPEYQEKLSALQLDSLRLVAEWYRKKRPEYFPAVRHFFDAETGDFYSHGLSIRQMTENALRPIDSDPEETARRVNERVENETPRIIKKVGGFVLGQIGIRTISECTDKAIDDYKSDAAAGRAAGGYNGYVPEIEKLMIRDMRFDERTGDRFEEQVGLPGTYINHYVIQQALKRKGVDAGSMDKTSLHGNQLIVADDLIDFVRLLDTVASEEWCTDVYMGEAVAPGITKNYENIRAEAISRQAGLEDQAGTVATFIMDLAADGVDRRKAPELVEAFVKKLLLNMAKDNVSLANQMFDERTGLGLQAVSQLEAAGRYQEAYELMKEVETAAPGGGYCGAGSCGLESVDAMGEAGKALSKKLQADSGDTLVRDKERACRCGQKSIVYAYNKHKVNKYCESCGSFESKKTG